MPKQEDSQTDTRFICPSHLLDRSQRLDTRTRAIIITTDARHFSVPPVRRSRRKKGNRERQRLRGARHVVGSHLDGPQSSQCNGCDRGKHRLCMGGRHCTGKRKGVNKQKIGARARAEGESAPRPSHRTHAAAPRSARCSRALVVTLACNSFACAPRLGRTGGEAEGEGEGQEDQGVDRAERVDPDRGHVGRRLPRGPRPP